MFSLFARYHRHKDLEAALISLSEEISTLRFENVRLRAKFAVDERERLKKVRANTAKGFPQDVKDVLAQFPDGEVEAVFDEQGHAIYSKNQAKLEVASGESE